MSKKKPAKNVIDHDPLAWLAEDNTDACAVTDADEMQQGSPRQGDSPAQSVTGESTDSAATAAYGFFDDAPAAAAIDSEPAAFGFFDKTEDASAAASDNSSNAVSQDDDPGYGFFEQDSSLTTRQANIDADSNVINLGAELTIRCVANCKQLIEQNLNAGFDIRLAAGELQKIDSAGLQLLYSLKMTLAKTARQIHWESTSNIIDQAASQIGMPKFCDEQSDPAYGFFADDDAGAADNSTQDGYGFF